MTSRTKLGVLVLVLLMTVVTFAGLSTAQAPLAKPVLVLKGQEPVDVRGKQFIRYNYFVANADAYPDTLFAASPNLPPCGANTKAARTWVSFFDKGGKQLNAFCALGGHNDLNGIWFALDPDVIPPSYVHIELNDRQTNTKVTSNDADTTL
jgi:hypothetical protein